MNLSTPSSPLSFTLAMVMQDNGGQNKNMKKNDSHCAVCTLILEIPPLFSLCVRESSPTYVVYAPIALPRCALRRPRRALSLSLPLYQRGSFFIIQSDAETLYFHSVVLASLGDQPSWGKVGKQALARYMGGRVVDE